MIFQKMSKKLKLFHTKKSKERAPSTDFQNLSALSVVVCCAEAL